MLKGKLKVEILNTPQPDGLTQWIGSANYYNVYVANDHGVPITFFHQYKSVIYEYDGTTQETTELDQVTTNEARTYAGFDIQTADGISKIEIISRGQLTWIEPLAEVTATN